MNKRKRKVLFSDNLDDCVVNHGYIERLRKTHLNRTMPSLLTIDLEEYQENNNRILLMMRQEGFDVVVISNDNVLSVEYFREYVPAKAHYDYIKQLIFEQKGEKW